MHYSISIAIKCQEKDNPAVIRAVLAFIKENTDTILEQFNERICPAGISIDHVQIEYHEKHNLCFVFLISCQFSSTDQQTVSTIAHKYATAFVTSVQKCINKAHGTNPSDTLCQEIEFLVLE